MSSGESDRTGPQDRVRIPRSLENDYTDEMASVRRAFIRERTGVELVHLARSSIPPAALHNHIENYIGVAQVPVGLAGPLRIQGEHARGDFYVPLATTEGALVASYGRGMKLLTESGGVKTTVVETAMQRAPAFILGDALEAREFGRWVEEHLPDLRREAEATTRVGKLASIGQYQVGPIRYLRFNFTTGDAAGQNMTSKATYQACEWIRRTYPRPVRYLLSGNLDTDKKHSHVNTLLTRGRRVVAEAILRKDLGREILGVDLADMFAMRQVQMTGAFLSGSSSNAAQAANALAALFIATGQDAACVAESQACLGYSQLLAGGDYYWSITLPSLIVATCGGGTNLPTQQECLEVLGCSGQGKADKLAEICAAVALAGEISLAGAVLHGDWVSSHERLGRNRP